MPSPRNQTSQKLPFRQRLRSNLIGYFVLLAILPLGITAILNVFSQINQARTQVTVQLESVTELKEAQVDAWIRQAGNLLNHLVEEIADEQNPEAFIEREIREFQAIDPFFLEIFYYDLEGNVLVSTASGAEGQSVILQPFFTPSLQDPYVQSPFYALRNDELVMYITQPLHNEQGEVIGIFAGKLDLGVLSDIMQQRTGLGESGETYLVSLQANYLISTSRFADYSPTQSTRSIGIDTALNRQDGAGTYNNYMNPPIRVIAVYRWLPQLDAALMAEIDEAQALSAIIRSVITSSTLAILSAVGSIAFGLIVSRWLTKPLVQLTQVTNQFSVGNLSSRANLQVQNEIGLLGASFNEMAESLQISYENLEAQVQERTETLAQANEQLQREADERKRAEQEIYKLNNELEDRVRLRTIELENSNRELDAFAYSVSHDLRAPLRAITGFSQAILEDYTHLLDEEGQSYLNDIIKAGKRMDQLIQDLLHLSRVTRSDLNRTQINLSDMVHLILDTLQSQDSQRQITVLVENNVRAYADEQLLAVVFNNLITNAWKFTSKKDIAEIEFYTIEQDNETVYVLKDNGAGFDMAYVDKLFGVFQRLHHAVEFEGTGIGLAIVQRVIHKHGGRIWSDAKVDQGATFYFTLQITI